MGRPKSNKNAKDKAPIKPSSSSRVVLRANKLKHKYKRGFILSPTKGSRARRALYDIKEKKVRIRNTAHHYNLSYGFLHYRLAGDIQIDKRKGPSPVFNRDEVEKNCSVVK